MRTLESLTHKSLFGELMESNNTRRGGEKDRSLLKNLSMDESNPVEVLHPDSDWCKQRRLIQL